jgi:4-diphosphocytidyl-2-C-methyl-D-erythritol kinase
MQPISELARAKINLTLSVLGRRSDGYHEIESLVTFADIGDRVTLVPGFDTKLTASGPFAADIAGENIIDTAIRLLRDIDPELRIGAVKLEKRLPVAAGLGGGSADAAAFLRAVRGANPERAARIPWQELAARLGSDVPVCLASAPACVWGTGSNVVRLSGPLPSLPAVLVNPKQPLLSACVYQALRAREAPARRSPPASAGPFARADEVIRYMRAHGNGLERAAARIVPAIADIKAALGALADCQFVGLSGSGPTCFGIFGSEQAAQEAARTLRTRHSGWWIVASRLGD